MRFLALSALVFGLPPFHSAIRPLAPPERAQLIGEFWHAGCPVPLSSLSLLTVSHWDFAGNVQTGQLVVNRRAAAPLARVLRRLYGLRFPIRHMTFSDYYGPKVGRPRDGDVSEGFECRRAVPSPAGRGTGNRTGVEHISDRIRTRAAGARAAPAPYLNPREFDRMVTAASCAPSAR